MEPEMRAANAEYREALAEARKSTCAKTFSDQALNFSRCLLQKHSTTNTRRPSLLYLPAARNCLFRRLAEDRRTSRQVQPRNTWGTYPATAGSFEVPPRIRPARTCARFRQVYAGPSSRKDSPDLRRCQGRSRAKHTTIAGSVCGCRTPLALMRKIKAVDVRNPTA